MSSPARRRPEPDSGRDRPTRTSAREQRRPPRAEKGRDGPIRLTVNAGADRLGCRLGEVRLLPSRPVKWARVLLLVLLSAMLPIRGVMAAALLCPPHAGAVGDAHTLPVAGESADGDAVAPTHDGSESPHHDGGASPSHHHESASGTDTCNLCSACCSVPPLPSTAPAVPLPHDTARAVFPSFAAPAPTFQSEGPERPPRSI